MIKLLKQFIPDKLPSLNREEVKRLFQKGDLHNAFKQLKKSGYQFVEFQEEIQIGAQKMVISNRATELLGYIYKYGFNIQYDIKTLLIATFNAGDFHGFLKNVFRFNFYKGLEKEIEISIDHLRGKGQMVDAQAWRRKINSLKN